MIKKLTEHIKLHREKWMFWTIAAAGLLLRFEYLREFSREVYFPFAIGADISEYDTRARELLNGIIFSAEPEIHAPLYSWFLAVFYCISGASVGFVRLIQLVLNWAAYLFMSRQLGKISGSRKIANTFLALAMFTPVLFFHQAELISEALLAPVLAGFFWFKYAGKDDPRREFGAGVMLGLALLTHGLMSFFAAAEVVYAAWRRQWKTVGCLLGGIALMILPVAAGKSIYYGKVTGIQGNSGFNLWIGNNPDADGGCYLRPGSQWSNALQSARQEAAARGVGENRIFAEKIIKFYWQNPAQLVILPLKKAALLIAPAEPIAGADPECLIRRTRVQKIGSGMMAAVLLLASGGIIFAVKKREKIYIHFYLLVGAGALGLLLTVVSGRYRQGLMPGLLLLAALGAVYLGKKAYLVIVPTVAAGAVLSMFACRSIPCRAEAASIIGEAYFRIRDFDRAEDLLMTAEAYVDHPERFHNMLGAIAEEKGDVNSAVSRYIRAVLEAPDDHNGYLNLGHIYFYKFPEKRQDALFLINAALTREAALPSAYDMLGQHYAQQGNLPGALEMFETALKYEPDNELYIKKVNFCRGVLAKEK